MLQRRDFAGLKKGVPFGAKLLKLGFYCTKGPATLFKYSTTFYNIGLAVDAGQHLKKMALKHPLPHEC